MAKNEKQKLKLIYLAKYFQEESDEDHKLSMSDILSYLEAMGVKAERKSIYDDITCLNDIGMDIAKEKSGKTMYYYLASRDFEAAELKLLVDSVQTAKFISAKKSSELIRKLEKLTGKHQAAALQRQVYVAGRVKSDNQKLYYSVNEIHNAINANRKISFHYYKWNIDGSLSPKGEKPYVVSPWAMTVDNGNYYLVAYDSEAGTLKHFRVDKIMNVEILDEMREGRLVFEAIDVSDYEKQHFGMYHGEEQMVHLSVTNDKAGIFFDRFGTDIKCISKDDDHVSIRVKVNLSDNFLGWVMGLGEGVEIEGPENARKEAERFASEIAKIYLK